MFVCASAGYSQIMPLQVMGGNWVTQGSEVTIKIGSSLDFRITNSETTKLENLKINDNDISIITDFNINRCNPKVYIVQVNTPNRFINRKEIIK